MRNLSSQVYARPAERTVLLREILDAAWLPKMVFQEERVQAVVEVTTRVFSGTEKPPSTATQADRSAL